MFLITLEVPCESSMSTVRHIWSILLPRQRRAGVVLFALVLIGTLLETFSIGLVVPALAFMTRGASEPSPRLTRWLEWLGNPSSNQLILLVLLLLLGVYAFKSAFLLFVAYWQSRFVSASQASTSRRLFSISLTQPWTFASDTGAVCHGGISHAPLGQSHEVFGSRTPHRGAHAQQPLERAESLQLAPFWPACDADAVSRFDRSGERQLSLRRREKQRLPALFRPKKRRLLFRQAW